MVWLREGRQYGRGGGKRSKLRRTFSGDLHVAAEPHAAQPLSVPALQNLPRGQAAGSRRSGTASAENEEEGFHPRRSEALRRAAESADSHGRQRESVRRDPGQEVLRPR